MTAYADDTFDLSAEQQQIAELGIPTVSSVSQLKTTADNLWNQKDYANAAPAYANYAKQANWLANIIASGLEPFYSGNSKNFSPSSITWNMLTSAEDKANSYKSERNRAMVQEGLCYYYMNDYEMAMPLLIKALDLVDIKDQKNWKLAMDALYSIVGYK